MLNVSKDDIINRMQRDNPWWLAAENYPQETDWPRRDYYPAFQHLASLSNIRRAIVLMGPRRVGKTVMAKQFISDSLSVGVPSQSMMFISLDTPILIGQPLETLLQIYLENFGDETKGGWIVFDEIQYLKDWEIHLKSLVDSYPTFKFIATGSAAAVLKRQSQESGAGRFTDFILPPLSFAEFLKFRHKPVGADIDELNQEFMKYLAYGGYPEIVRNPKLEKNADQYLRSDIIDKVLLRDLPTLYGVSDIQEMHRLFSTLVFNTGQELSLEGLSQSANVGKAALKRYIDYLEGAFLIRKLSRVDDTAKAFKRERTFKVYVTNPALYSALFGILEPDDERMGALAETAVLAQAFNSFWDQPFRYARWKNGREEGEVDLVSFHAGTQKLMTAMEVKWSNGIAKDARLARNITTFVRRAMPQISYGTITTRNYEGQMTYRGVDLSLIPTAKACLEYANDAVFRLNKKIGLHDQPELDL